MKNCKDCCEKENQLPIFAGDNLKELCYLSKAMKQFYKSVVSEECFHFRIQFGIAIENFFKQSTNNQCCIALQCESFTLETGLMAYEVRKILCLKMPVALKTTGAPDQIYSTKTYQRFEKDLSDWGTKNKAIVLSRLSKFYRCSDNCVKPICVTKLKPEYQINMLFSDFEIAHRCQCEMPGRFKYACDFN